MSDLKHRLALALDYRHSIRGKGEPRVSQAALARACGVTAPSVSDWFSGATKSLASDSLLRASAYLKVRPEWLANGKGPMEIIALPGGAASNVDEAPTLRPSRNVPVVGHVKAGDFGYLEEMQYPVGHGEGVVEYWVNDPQAFALRIKGDSMHPRYRAGEFVVITPSIEAAPGRDVVVTLKNGKKLLKQLNWMRSGELQLLSINNGYAPMTIDMIDVERVLRVAGSVPPDSFIPN